MGRCFLCSSGMAPIVVPAFSLSVAFGKLAGKDFNIKRIKECKQ